MFTFHFSIFFTRSNGSCALTHYLKGFFMEYYFAAIQVLTLHLKMTIEEAVESTNLPEKQKVHLRELYYGHIRNTYPHLYDLRKK